MLNKFYCKTQAIKDIEKLCSAIAQRNKISFVAALECLSEDKQAAYDEYLASQYTDKLNAMFGAQWFKKASPAVLYNVSVKNYKKHIYTL